LAALQPVRGTHDLLPDDMRRHRHVGDTARTVAARYGYHEVATPIFEFTEVFKRTLGEVSDVVSKEMYTFEDRGGEEITLRPENTAGVARAYLSGGLAQQAPCKFFYQGPMFRYERPQKGRLRQFHQIGLELIGVAGPQGDVEIIACGAAILDGLGVLPRTQLEINTLGDPESRTAYREALVRYFSGHLDALSEDSRMRLERNPLRILDSKDPGDKALVAEAPLFDDHLNQASRDHFQAVTDGLDAIGIAWERNPWLVRGLDYYGHTAFEFTTTELGAQNAVMAGGRYDGLIGQMGGPETPGVGWAAGVERLALLGGDPPPEERPVAVVPVGSDAEPVAVALADRLRRAGMTIEIGYSGNLSRRLKRANKLNADRAVLIGGDELAQGVATLRDLDTGEQQQVPLDALPARLAGSG